ncbi:Molybdopterin or thiamine biosynthesis adenylyltransferase [Desulfacinum hydrothermale DSM 13146]|uniref:Molybdopterin or thiamine biosynthesis adenylyltransferase n=1 Tax=Desulfacinum hydrothermale DSM 13146 TaxID=1121390 RepID=A0A1W1XAX0_9BACT|nr:ThiF family adenylyltransferase [Desulfacinum hydrothermale]SMC21010.1 Molybdopterin or thiamine biosynthesis adenylyltransferase [Desulfacinum hydrothermale DSM 13146]
MDPQTYYQTAFSRNLGIFTEAEQELLRRSRVAVAGLGGVGGLHVITLARMGVGAFHLADRDAFELANMNRQYGAKVPHLGRPKLEVMVEEARAVNPHLDIVSFPEGVDIVSFPEGVMEDNLDRFLEGVHVVLDGLDFFCFDVRRKLFNRALERGLHVVTAGPLGFTTAVLVFSPHEGMTFDDYFDVRPGLTEEEEYLRFAMGLAPRPLHLRHMDLDRVSLTQRAGPSVAAACQLCAAAAATEAVKILLGRGPLRPVPHYLQIDPYSWTLRRGRLRLGNRHPAQKIKAWAIRRFLLSDASDNRPKTVLFLRSLIRRGSAPAANLPDCRPRPPAPSSPVQGPPVSRDVLAYLLDAAVQAPSGDNAQPWKLSAKEDSVCIQVDPNRDRSFFNVDQVASVIACGAAAENVRIAATAFGLRARMSVSCEGGEEHLAARIGLEPADVSPDPLHPWIWKRHTNRKPFGKTRLSPVAAESLQQAVIPFPGARLHLVQDRERLKKLARLIYWVDRIRSEDRRLHEHLHHMIRPCDEEALRTRDGFPIKNLEAGRMGELFLRFSRPWPVMNVLNRLGASRAVARHAAQGMAQAAAAGLLTVSGPTAEDFFHGGRALQTIWLTATAHGLAFQPMTAVTLFWTRAQRQGLTPFYQRHHRLLERAFALYQDLFPHVDFYAAGHVMLFRLGHAPPITTPTLRRPAPVEPTRRESAGK